MRRIKSLLFLMVAGVMASCGSQSEEQAAQAEVVIPQVRVKQVFEREVDNCESFCISTINAHDSKYILSFFNLKLLSVSISLLKNLISGPYNKVSSLLTPGIILSRVSSPSTILVIILCGKTKAKSPATQSFNVGSINPLL